MRTRNTIQRIWIIIMMSFVGIYTYGQDTIQVLQKSCKYTFVIPEGWDTIPPVGSYAETSWIFD